jgi:membrane protease YdiL (CAAX protease family)
MKTILLRAALVAPALLLIAWLISPETLFIFPRTRPALWVLVMVLYPLLSAYPQELIYRAFFLRRYGSLFKTESQMIWASTLAFAFLHIIFKNPVAVILTIPGGYLLSKTYGKTKSLLVTSIEHAIYGDLVFTIGLGFYFYKG